jgi:hypothetical protein
VKKGKRAAIEVILFYKLKPKGFMQMVRKLKILYMGGYPNQREENWFGPGFKKNFFGHDKALCNNKQR